jgi:hypothetical protein
VSTQNKWRWIGPVTTLLLCFCAAQPGSAADMFPAAESVRDATEEFDQAWRWEARCKFAAAQATGSSALAAYLLPGFLVFAAAALVHFMVKLNHMERTLRSVRADRLGMPIRMWLISRWGLRY